MASPADTPTSAASTVAPPRGGRTPAGQQAEKTAPESRRRQNWFSELYRSTVGKKYVMALSGLVLMGYVLVHMIGNLKIYLGAADLNAYAEWLRAIGAPALPHGTALWVVRVVLIVAVALHGHAAYSLTMANRRARSVGYQSKRHYVAADFAARTMRWGGIIIALFIVFHLLDLTWGVVNPDFESGNVYHNVVASFQRWPVSLFYILANLALGLHLYHGVWSLFQSMGWSSRRMNHWRRYVAVVFAVVVVGGNITFPVAVLTGVVA